MDSLRGEGEPATKPPKSSSSPPPPPPPHSSSTSPMLAPVPFTSLKSPFPSPSPGDPATQASLDVAQATLSKKTIRKKKQNLNLQDMKGKVAVTKE